MHISRSPVTQAYGSVMLVRTGITVSCPRSVKLCTVNEIAVARLPVSRNKRKPGSATTIVVARARATIRGGRSQQITFRLDRAGARLLERLGSLKVTISLITRTPGGATLLTTKTITLKAPPRHRRTKPRH